MRKLPQGHQAVIGHLGAAEVEFLKIRKILKCLLARAGQSKIVNRQIRQGNGANGTAIPLNLSAFLTDLLSTNLLANPSLDVITPGHRHQSTSIGEDDPNICSNTFLVIAGLIGYLPEA